jgi:hypothetical protein
LLLLPGLVAPLSLLLPLLLLRLQIWRRRAHPEFLQAFLQVVLQALLLQLLLLPELLHMLPPPLQEIPHAHTQLPLLLLLLLRI